MGLVAGRGVILPQIRDPIWGRANNKHPSTPRFGPWGKYMVPGLMWPLTPRSQLSPELLPTGAPVRTCRDPQAPSPSSGHTPPSYCCFAPSQSLLPLTLRSRHLEDTSPTSFRAPSCDPALYRAPSGSSAPAGYTAGSERRKGPPSAGLRGGEAAGRVPPRRSRQ